MDRWIDGETDVEVEIVTYSISFISNIYKQRFFQPVDFSEKKKQQTNWNQKFKQRLEII